MDFLGEKEFGRAFLGLLKSVHIPGSQFYVKDTSERIAQVSLKNSEEVFQRDPLFKMS